MSELEILVRTRFRKRAAIDELILPDCQEDRWTSPTTKTCLGRADRAQPYHCSVYKNRVTIEVDTETLRTMQKENNAEDACIDVISDDEVMEDPEEEEELDTFRGFDVSPMSASSGPDSPGNATSSPINIPGMFGPGGPRTRSASCGGSTPPTQCLSYLFPGVHCDNSPLSSGYGSAPRYSASTQTPSTPVFCETSIRLRILGLAGNQSDKRQQAMTRQQRIQMQERRARGRVYSENNSDDLRGDGEEEEEVEDGESSSASAGMPLPDLVAFRDRSNSAPTSLMRPEIRVGRQLRRISDEFHLSYHDQQSLRARQQQTILQRLLNTLRGSHRGHREGSAV